VIFFASPRLVALSCPDVDKQLFDRHRRFQHALLHHETHERLQGDGQAFQAYESKFRILDQPSISGETLALARSKALWSRFTTKMCCPVEYFPVQRVR
jgi:hypothetical protein